MDYQFQCMHKVPVLQMTVHIIAHHRKLQNHTDIYKHLTDWIPSHMCWICDVSKEFLGEQGLWPEDFANNMISPKIPVDKLGLLVIARMYHTHFGVILKDRSWTTTGDNSTKYCKFFLMHQGSVSFTYTVTGNWDLPSSPAVLLKISDDVQKEAVNLVRDKSKVPPHETASMLPLDMHNKHESNPHSPEKMVYDHKMDSKSSGKVDLDRETDSTSTDKKDLHQKVDTGDKNMDLDQNQDDMDLDRETDSKSMNKMDFNQKVDAGDNNMDLDHNVDSPKVDCATKPSAPEVDSNKTGSQKMECTDTNKENRAFRQCKRPASSSWCLQSSESVCNKKPKVECSSHNSQKAGKLIYDLSDLIRAKGHSHSKPQPKQNPTKTEKSKKDKVSVKNEKTTEQGNKEKVSEKKTHNHKDSDMPETVKEQKDRKNAVKPEIQESDDNNKTESVNETKDGQETENGTSEPKEGDNNKTVSVNETKDGQKTENGTSEPKEGDNHKTEIPNENKDGLETEHATSDNDTKSRQAKPLGLIETDPILKAFANVHNMDEALELLDISDNEKPKKYIAVETKIETDIGVMNIKEYGLKPTQKHDRQFSCSFNEDCNKYFSTQGQLNKHLQTVHKASFPCLKCDKIYDTVNGLNKHFHKHFKFNNICSHCGKGFQFPKQLSIHEGSHTDSLVGKFVCPTGGCSKVFLSKQGLEAH